MKLFARLALADCLRSRQHSPADLDRAADYIERAELPHEPIDYEQRNKLLRSFRSLYLANVTDREAARKILRWHNDYLSADWPPHQHENTCPPEIKGTRRGWFWEITRAGGELPDIEQVRKILGSRIERLPTRRLTVRKSK